MKAVFLDRDGVVNRNAKEHRYIIRLNQLKVLPGSKEAVEDLYNAGFQLFIVSNQPGIAKRLLTERQLDRIHKKLQEELGNRIEHIYYCPHRKEDNCNCRKPKPGMLLGTAKDYNLNLSECYYIGDAEEDIEAAKRAGCKMIFVLTGRGISQIKNRLSWRYQPDFIKENLFKASRLILENRI